MSEVNNKQIGGDHYRAPIQHWDYVEYNGLRYLEGCATKYATRNRKKHEDPTQDLQKAVHYVEKLQDLHRNGVIEPRTAPTPLSPEDFARANGLTPNEAEVIRALTFWEADPELTATIALLNRMIEEARS